MSCSVHRGGTEGLCVTDHVNVLFLGGGFSVPLPAISDCETWNPEVRSARLFFRVVCLQCRYTCRKHPLFFIQRVVHPPKNIKQKLSFTRLTFFLTWNTKGDSFPHNEIIQWPAGMFCLKALTHQTLGQSTPDHHWASASPVFAMWPCWGLFGWVSMLNSWQLPVVLFGMSWPYEEIWRGGGNLAVQR